MRATAPIPLSAPGGAAGSSRVRIPTRTAPASATGSSPTIIAVSGRAPSASQARSKMTADGFTHLVGQEHLVDQPVQPVVAQHSTHVPARVGHDADADPRTAQHGERRRHGRVRHPRRRGVHLPVDLPAQARVAVIPPAVQHMPAFPPHAGIEVPRMGELVGRVRRSLHLGGIGLAIEIRRALQAQRRCGVPDRGRQRCVGGQRVAEVEQHGDHGAGHRASLPGGCNRALACPG